MSKKHKKISGFQRFKEGLKNLIFEKEDSKESKEAKPHLQQVIRMTPPSSNGKRKNGDMTDSASFKEALEKFRSQNSLEVTDLIISLSQSLSTDASESLENTISDSKSLSHSQSISVVAASLSESISEVQFRSNDISLSVAESVSLSQSESVHSMEIAESEVSELESLSDTSVDSDSIVQSQSIDGFQNDEIQASLSVSMSLSHADPVSQEQSLEYSLSQSRQEESYVVSLSESEREHSILESESITYSLNQSESESLYDSSILSEQVSLSIFASQSLSESLSQLIEESQSELESESYSSSESLSNSDSLGRYRRQRVEEDSYFYSQNRSKQSSHSLNASHRPISEIRNIPITGKSVSALGTKNALKFVNANRSSLLTEQQLYRLMRPSSQPVTREFKNMTRDLSNLASITKTKKVMYKFDK